MNRVVEEPSRKDPSGGKRFRWTVRLTCLAAAVAAFLPPWSSDAAVRAVPALSPFVALSAAIAERALTSVAVLAVPVLLAALVRRRMFCRYFCPTGVLVDGSGRAGRLVATLGRRLLDMRRPADSAAADPAPGRVRRPPLGHALVWITLGGAALGYPLLVWLDPLALFAAFAGAWQTEPVVPWIAAAGLPIVLLACFCRPGLWCGRLCPLGACQEILYDCARCGRRQPDGESGRSRWVVARRGVLALGLGAVATGALFRRVLNLPREQPLRPPGAVPPWRFTGLCVRCGNCIRVCPSGILHPDLDPARKHSLLTPVLRYADRYCEENCRRCGDVCPSGALRPLAEDEKPKVRIGLPRVDMEICKRGSDEECSLCRTACPYGAVRFVFSESDYLTRPVIHAGRCNGCGACQIACPTAPKAIRVVPA